MIIIRQVRVKDHLSVIWYDTAFSLCTVRVYFIFWTMVQKELWKFIHLLRFKKYRN